MSSKTTPTTRNGVLLALASLALAAGLTATGIGAQTAGGNGADREPNFHSLRERGDIKFLPAPLQDRLVELARRPHSYLPLTVFSEADEPSQLFGYYLLDTTGFPPNVFTSIVPGINDNGVIPTGANFANGGLPTVGAVRVTLEPKPGLPTDPDDPRAFIDMFTDISGLFVINNESGWYEGWMLHDLRVPPVAAPLADGRAQFGTMTPADAAALAARGTGNNVPGRFFTLDGNAVRFSSADDSGQYSGVFGEHRYVQCAATERRARVLGVQPRHQLGIPALRTAFHGWIARYVPGPPVRLAVGDSGIGPVWRGQYGGYPR